jgi:hypothetical protein
MEIIICLFIVAVVLTTYALCRGASQASRREEELLGDGKEDGK